MYLNNLLTAYGATIGISSLKFDENNVCHLIFDQGHELVFEPSPDNCFASLYSVLGHIPAVDVQTFYEAVLDRNLFGIATGHASICVDKNVKEVILFQAINPMYSDSSAFIFLVEAFIDQYYQQQKWLNSFMNSGCEPTEVSTRDSHSNTGFRV
jgi:hypothetical protein